MESHMLRGLIVLVLLAACEMAIPNSEVGSASVSSQQPKASALQKVESWYYSLVCTLWGVLPLWLAGLPLKLTFLKERMVKVGPPLSCANLILTVEYRFTNGNDLKKKLVENKLPVVWVLGGPGSGKGTHCKEMADSEGFTHISVGDSLRAAVREDPNSFNSRLLDWTMKQGVLLPDSVALTFLMRELMTNIDSSKGFLIDGFPRNLDQAKQFQKKIKPPDAIISLKVSDETMKNRVLNRKDGRPDDNEETIKMRLQVFHKEQQLITSNKMFASKVKEISGDGEKKDNFQRFSKAIHESLKAMSSNSQGV